MRTLLFTPIVLSALVIFCQPILADIIQPSVLEQERPATPAELQKTLNTLGLTLSPHAALTSQDMAYFAAEPDRVQVVAGLTFSEALWGLIMVGAGTALAIMWGHQLSK